MVGDKSEFVIFSEEILKGSDETKEFAPALCYLIKNNYEVKIIDPSPLNNNLWGGCFNDTLLDGKPRNYRKSDIEQYVRDGWSIVFSTLGTNNKPKPHAILAFKEKLYDPECERYWKNPFSLDEYLKRKIKLGRFLIAFRKYR